MGLWPFLFGFFVEPYCEQNILQRRKKRSPNTVKTTQNTARSLWKVGEDLSTMKTASRTASSSLTMAAVVGLFLSTLVPFSHGFTVPSHQVYKLRPLCLTALDNNVEKNTTSSFKPSEGINRALEDTSMVVDDAMKGDQASRILLEKWHGVKSDVYPQCVDIVRDLKGQVHSVQYFAEKLGVHADSYTCPEKDAFRGLMSNACRVRLWPGGQTVFYKRIIFRDIPHAQEKLAKAPYKLITDAKSYQVVTSFLSSQACHQLCETTGVQIPKCLDAQLEPNYDNPIDSKFSFLLEDYSPEQGWAIRWLLEEENECHATLTTLAKIHAFFWTGSSFWNDPEAAEEISSGIWKSASYVQPKRNPNHWKTVAEKWKTERLKFEKVLKGMDYWDNLGERLQSVAKEAGNLAHPFAHKDSSLTESYQKYRTFCHGDPKQANYLFRSRSPDEEQQLPEVGVVDFQWSGFGLAASDIAHFMTSAVHADQLVNGGEEKLLKYYYDELQTYLVEYGACATPEDALEHFSWELFLEQYETGVLDICRLVIAYTWSRFDLPTEGEDGYARTFNTNSYNKSLANVVWLTSRCDEILKSRGV